MCGPWGCITVILGAVLLGAAGGIGYKFVKASRDGKRMGGKLTQELSPSAAGYARCAFGKCKG